MDKLLTYIDDFFNILDFGSLRLRNINKIDNNIISINYSNNKITKIKNLNNELLELILNNNKIRKIENINNELKILRLANNKINKIQNLTNNIKILSLSHNKIRKINNLNNGIEELYLDSNQIQKINNLTINLEILNLSFNQINKIENLSDNIVNLNLNHNLISKIENLTNNITQLYLSYNFINKIEKLSHNITYLNLSHNNISKIEYNSLPPKLVHFDISHNKINEIPIYLLELKYLKFFKYNNNPIYKISIHVQRWLNTLNRINNNKIYTDKENIHTHNIQQSFRNSLYNIINNNKYNSLELVDIKNQINECTILDNNSKRLINLYCNDKTIHSVYFITFADLFSYVWNRIINSEHKEQLLIILNDEINNCENLCFMGRMVRLVNTLVGFYSDIEIQISDSEQIANIIISIKDKYILEDNKLIKNKIYQELLDRNYDINVINEWLEYI